MIEAERLRQPLIEHLLRFGVRRADGMVMAAKAERLGLCCRRRRWRWSRCRLWRGRAAGGSHDRREGDESSHIALHFTQFDMLFKRVVVSLLALAIASATIAAQRGGGGLLRRARGPPPRRSKGTSTSAAWHSVPGAADTAADGASITRAPTRTCRFACPSCQRPRSTSTSTAHPTTSSFRRQSPSCSNARS